MSIQTRFSYRPGDGVFRVYIGKEASESSPYQGIVSVKFFPNHAYLFGAVGDLSKPVCLKIICKLFSMGVRKIQMERAQGHVIPFGHVVDVKNKLPVWEVDLTSKKVLKLIQREMQCQRRKEK